MFVGLVLAALSGGAGAFLDDFRGTWNCGGTTWTIAQAPGDSSWASVTYAGRKTVYGTAYVGWLPQLQSFVYRDFHNDGSLAELTSAPPTDNTWTWTGAYYAGTEPVDTHGRVTWTYKAPGTIVRHFGKEQDGKYVELGHDECAKSG